MTFSSNRFQLSSHNSDNYVARELKCSPCYTHGCCVYKNITLIKELAYKRRGLDAWVLCASEHDATVRERRMIRTCSEHLSALRPMCARHEKMFYYDNIAMASWDDNSVTVWKREKCIFEVIEYHEKNKISRPHKTLYSKSGIRFLLPDIWVVFFWINSKFH